MTIWKIDPVHSTIGFKVKHLMVSTVKGVFREFSGTLNSPEEDFENTQVAFEAQVSSIDTNNETRDNHLRSPDFFNAEQHPVLKFSSNSFKKNTNGEYLITGDLSMNGVTKNITLVAESEGVGTNMEGTKIAGFDISGKINRQDFGLKWNATLETGGVVVSDEVNFDIHIEIIASE